MEVKLTPHIKKLAKKSVAVRRQFIPPKKIKKECYPVVADPLLEDRFIVTKGMIHKYKNRVLVTLTLDCPSYCQFCTRQRSVGVVKKYTITPKDIDQMVDYLRNHSQIKEVILSGGDPLIVPEILKYSLKRFSKLSQIKIIRINTGLPIDNPKGVTPDLVSSFKQIKKPLYLGLHFEHPDEITPATIKAIKILREAGCILYSQSVFLKGVNDSYKTLYKLFTRLVELGVMPYYIFRCDYVKGAERFIVDFEKEVSIMTKLRKDISGLAYPIYVIDTPNGSGKIPVPLNFWKFNKKKFKDFDNKTIRII